MKYQLSLSFNHSKAWTRLQLFSPLLKNIYLRKEKDKQKKKRIILKFLKEIFFYKSGLILTFYPNSKNINENSSHIQWTREEIHQSGCFSLFLSVNDCLIKIILSAKPLNPTQLFPTSRKSVNVSCLNFLVGLFIDVI